MTELVCSQEANTGSSRSPREMINLTAISQLWLLREAVRHKHIVNVFSHCVKMIPGCCDYIVIYLFKILTHMSSFGFFLCRKKRQVKCYIACTAKHLHVMYTQDSLRSRGFLWPTLYYKP